VNIKPVQGYWALGNTPFEREAAFMRLLREPLSPRVLDGVARGLSMGWPLLGREAWTRLPAEEREAWVVRPRGRPAGKTPLDPSLTNFDVSLI
jgi:putative transposase